MGQYRWVPHPFRAFCEMGGIPQTAFSTLLGVAVRMRVSLFFLAFALACAPSAAAQDRGSWMAASSNANSITGNISIREPKLTISLLTFPIAHIRSLDRKSTRL